MCVACSGKYMRVAIRKKTFHLRGGVATCFSAGRYRERRGNRVQGGALGAEADARVVFQYYPANMARNRH